MDLFKKVNKDLLKIINNYVSDVQDAGKYLKNVNFVIPPSETNSDYSTNAAMVLAKAKRKSPIIISEELAILFRDVEYIKSVDTINGYINIVFDEKIWEDFLMDIVAEGSKYGDGEKREKVLLEFISALYLNDRTIVILFHLLPFPPQINFLKDFRIFPSPLKTQMFTYFW